MTYGESNGHVIDDDTWPWNVKVVTPIWLGPIISKTAGDTDGVTMEHLQKNGTRGASKGHLSDDVSWAWKIKNNRKMVSVIIGFIRPSLDLIEYDRRTRSRGLTNPVHLGGIHRWIKQQMLCIIFRPDCSQACSQACTSNRLDFGERRASSPGTSLTHSPP